MRIKWKVEAEKRRVEINTLRVEITRLKIELDDNKRAAFENYQRMKRHAVVSGVPNAGYHEAERHERWKAQAGQP